MRLTCQECSAEYLGNKNGKYCSTKCYQRNSLSQYQKMKIELISLRKENRKLKLIIENGIGKEDLERNN